MHFMDTETTKILAACVILIGAAAGAALADPSLGSIGVDSETSFQLAAATGSDQSAAPGIPHNLESEAPPTESSIEIGPEPSTGVMLGLGMLGLGIVGRRR
jgi:hypothetical protein